MGKCSAQGRIYSLPTFSHFDVFFLAPIKTSKLEPLDAGIIASDKLQYRRRHLEHAVDLADVVVNDIYGTDILLAMRWLSSAWSEVTKKTSLNCWGTTGILSKGSLLPTVEDSKAPDAILKMHDKTASFVSALVPVNRWIFVVALVIFDEGVDCAELASDEESVQSLVATSANNKVCKNSVDDPFNYENETEGFGSIDDQLAAIAKVKRIVGPRSVERGPLLGLLRTLHADVRLEKIEGFRKTTIETSFY